LQLQLVVVVAAVLMGTMVELAVQVVAEVDGAHLLEVQQPLDKVMQVAEELHPQHLQIGLAAVAVLELLELVEQLAATEEQVLQIQFLVLALIMLVAAVVAQTAQRLEQAELAAVVMVLLVEMELADRLIRAAAVAVDLLALVLWAVLEVQAL
jgi:hypothetical protein